LFTARFDDAAAVYIAATYRDDGGEVFSTFDFARNAITLELPAESGAADGQLRTETALFRSSIDGTWRAEFETGATGCHMDQPGNPLCNYDTIGINGTWTRVPGPSTLALVALGLVGLVGVYRLTEEKAN